MTTWLPITYRGYWDIPRIILVRRADQLFLLDCQFDDELDEYPDEFTVYMMPSRFDDEPMPQDWTTLRDVAIHKLGTVPVTAVQFDPTHRKEIRSDIFDRLLPVTPIANGAPQHADTPATPVS